MNDVDSRTGLPGSPRLDQLVADDGMRWVEFRKSLTPNYRRVRFDIGLCHAMIVGAYSAIVLADFYLTTYWAAAVALPAAAFIGFWLHALCNFGHEAVHYNIARNRRTNDLLANVLIWPLFGQHVSFRQQKSWVI